MTLRDQTIIFNGIPRPNFKWFLATVVISLLLHLFSYVNVSHFADSVKENRSHLDRNSPVKIKIVSPASEAKQPKRIIEARQEETAKPKNAKFKSHQNHIAKKETRVLRKAQSINDLDSGDGGATKRAARRQEQKKKQKVTKKDESRARIGVGSGEVDENSQSAYSALLPRTSDLAASRKAGYQDYIEDEIELGDKIDLTTSSYRYIGYFTGLRKGWSQTWIYPSEAVRRGLQGKVKIEFTIEKDGELNGVKVVETSGHEILDEAVVEAVRLSSPYAPLPDGFGKDKLIIVYSFVYRLRGYGAF